ncbi:MAG: SUMF1/EgtB/PvdO family nonheme iron enzyme [Proteobacteria bacterium]|nr:SUMF1/EgtB/PvdO family nonheme iron enzyme [Pseudomonadota bacterium]
MTPGIDPGSPEESDLVVAIADFVVLDSKKVIATKDIAGEPLSDDEYAGHGLAPLMKAVSHRRGPATVTVENDETVGLLRRVAASVLQPGAKLNLLGSTNGEKAAFVMGGEAQVRVGVRGPGVNHDSRGRRATEADSKHRFPVLESRPTEPGGPGVNHEFRYTVDQQAERLAIAENLAELTEILGDLAAPISIEIPDDSSIGELLKVTEAILAAHPDQAVGLTMDWAPCVDFAPDMVCIPGGPAIVGNDDGPLYEQPEREIVISTFYLDKFEVTIAKHDVCTAAGGCDQRINKDKPVYKPFIRSVQPAVPIDGHRAAQYCAWAGKRLPSEWEWEKGARGPDGDRYPWGDDEPTCERTIFRECAPEPCPTPGHYTHVWDCPDHYTQDVGSFPAGHYGLHEMAGNGYEWTATWGLWVLSRCEGHCTGINPQGPCDGAPDCEYTDRVLRGGSWYWPKKQLHGSHRRLSQLDTGGHRLSVRCAVDHPWTTEFPPRILVEQPPQPADPDPPNPEALSIFNGPEDQAILVQPHHGGAGPNSWESLIGNAGGVFVGLSHSDSEGNIGLARPQWAWLVGDSALGLNRAGNSEDAKFVTALREQGRLRKLRGHIRGKSVLEDIAQATRGLGETVRVLDLSALAPGPLTPEIRANLSILPLDAETRVLWNVDGEYVVQGGLHLAKRLELEGFSRIRHLFHDRIEANRSDLKIVGLPGAQCPAKVIPFQYGTSQGPARLVSNEPDSEWFDMDWVFYLVLMDDKRILIDTGLGDLALVEKYGLKDYVAPVELLRRRGIEPSTITHVVLTHGHADHAGSLHHFKNAQILVQQVELDSLTKMPEFAWLSEAKDQVVAVDGELAPFAGLHLVPSGGHTTGSQVAIVESGICKWVFVGDECYSRDACRDKVHLPAEFAEHPEANAAFIDGSLARWIEEGAMVMAFHER